MSHYNTKTLIKRYTESCNKDKDSIKIMYLPKGSPEFNAVEESWRQGKYNVLSKYYSRFSQLKQEIS